MAPVKKTPTGFNIDQAFSILRSVLKIGGGILVGVGAVDQETGDAISALGHASSNAELLSGVLMTGIGLGLSYATHRAK